MVWALHFARWRIWSLRWLESAFWMTTHTCWVSHFEHRTAQTHEYLKINNKCMSKGAAKWTYRGVSKYNCISELKYYYIFRNSVQSVETSLSIMNIMHLLMTMNFRGRCLCMLAQIETHHCLPVNGTQGNPLYPTWWSHDHFTCDWVLNLSSSHWKPERYIQ